MLKQFVNRYMELCIQFIFVNPNNFNSPSPEVLFLNKKKHLCWRTCGYYPPHWKHLFQIRGRTHVLQNDLS